ncbi:tRNA (adenosine(37)-N6)-threonylcarbamoyltransferase complex dimerization subunit type 1 TsaB, partial [Microbacterium sp. ZXX196]|nr:tRNA (adenosine(37)-N6)-threonylcarbamoyltransferase complex dimerization subunit type 1 TsaB [Microbacterium sp. ZXX196]
MKVLAIDTSNYVMGVSLIEEENVIGEIITNLTKNHSVR